MELFLYDLAGKIPILKTAGDALHLWRLGFRTFLMSCPRWQTCEWNVPRALPFPWRSICGPARVPLPSDMELPLAGNRLGCLTCGLWGGFVDNMEVSFPRQKPSIWGTWLPHAVVSAAGRLAGGIRPQCLSSGRWGGAMVAAEIRVCYSLAVPYRSHADQTPCQTGWWLLSSRPLYHSLH